MKASEYTIASNNIGLIETNCCHSQFAFKIKDIIHKNNKEYIKCLGCNKIIEIAEFWSEKKSPMCFSEQDDGGNDCELYNENSPI